MVGNAVTVAEQISKDLLRSCPPALFDDLSNALGLIAGMHAAQLEARSSRTPTSNGSRGGIVSALGDQLTMVALPWLVLKLTGDTLALGLVIALMSIPRAVFILIGGALVDRYSPKRVLMLSKYANAVLLALLTLLVLNLDAAPTDDAADLRAGTGPRPGAGVRHAIGDFHHAARHPAEHLQAANGV
jgi:hypothetical protein